MFFLPCSEKKIEDATNGNPNCQMVIVKPLISSFRWWMNLGIKERLSFSRDRVVESFLYAAGTAPEPKQASLRKWLSKVINLILITDDVYDVYGTLDELEIFTNAVERFANNYNPVCQPL